MMLNQTAILAEGDGIEEMFEICNKKGYDDDNSILIVADSNTLDSHWWIYDLPKQESNINQEEIAAWISMFVMDNYGEEELRDPSWSIDDLASYLSSKLSKE